MKKSLIGVVAALMACQTAFAADLYQAEPQPAFVGNAPEIQVQQASGWYLRGDVGYSFNKSRGAEYTRSDSGTAVDYSFSRKSVDDNFLFGGGVGYQITNYLRTDLTLDYMAKSKFSANGPLINNVSSAMRAYGLMANAYVDLGTYGRITPYVGAGIGGAYVKWDRLTACGNCEIDGKGDWRFAYGLMAGASIDVTCNLKADVGYRFRQIAGGDMFGISASGLTSAGRDKGITSHEIRVGGRYVFNGCDTAQYIPPADIPLQPTVYK